MDPRNFTYMFYGFLAAWLVLCAYLVLMVGRQRKIKSELERLRYQVEDKERGQGQRA